MSYTNLVSVVPMSNGTDVQVEVNGREICDVIECKHVRLADGSYKVALIIGAAQVNVVGANAFRDPEFAQTAHANAQARQRPASWWQRFKNWYAGRERAFEQWQNGD